MKQHQIQYNLQRWAVFHGTLQQAETLYESGQVHPTCLLHRFQFPQATNVVFDQFREMLGNRCRLAVTGSAPLSQ